MNLPNIILWTISLTLSTFSIIFASWAAYSAMKANKSLRDIITAELIINETTKLFFDQIKSVQKHNSNAISVLGCTVTYKKYATISTHTRFKIIPKISEKLILKTSYSKLTKKYIKFKEILDLEFLEKIDLKLLASQNKIPASLRRDLIQYHKKITVFTKEILADYAVESTR